MQDHRHGSCILTNYLRTTQKECTICELNLIDNNLLNHITKIAIFFVTCNSKILQGDGYKKAPIIIDATQIIIAQKSTLSAAGAKTPSTFNMDFLY